MSYGITVTIVDGKVSNHSTFGDLPDGVFQVTGHEDESTDSVGVARYDLPTTDKEAQAQHPEVRGTHRASASSFYRKAAG